MFPIRKLRELSPKTRALKAARLLKGMEEDFRHSVPVDSGYLKELLSAVAWNGGAAVTEEVESARLLALDALSLGRTGEELLRPLNGLRHALLHSLGAEPAEWDFIDAETGGLDASARKVLPIGAYLEDIRSPYNVGSIFRTAEAFGASRILLSPMTPRPDHPRASRTSRAAETVLPWSIAALEDLRGSPGVFALELGGTPVDDFDFPVRGTVLLGSEELGLSPEALRLAEESAGRVSIPMSGAKRSLNVSVAFGILMQRWHARLNP
jgi:RNA methyltransferase, TrmH family